MAKIEYYSVPDCPYETWQLVMATDILEWAYQQCQDRGLIPFNVCLEHPIDAINGFLNSIVIERLRLVRLCDYSTDELEQELLRRKEQ